MVKGEKRKLSEVKFLDKKFKVYIREVIEKRSYVSAVNNNAGSISVHTAEKRDINGLIAKHYIKQGMNVLDAYGGYGLSTYVWLKAGAKVTTVEMDEYNYDLLYDNLKEYLGAYKLKTFNEDNIKVMKSLIDTGKKFDVIDLDPYGSCFEQIPYALKLIKHGILLVTCGEHTVLYRGFHNKTYLKRYGEEVKPFFKYENFWRFAKDFFFEKYIKSLREDVELIHYNLNKKFGRLIIRVGYPVIPPELLSEFKIRQKVFQDVQKYEGQKSLMEL